VTGGVGCARLDQGQTGQAFEQCPNLGSVGREAMFFEHFPVAATAQQRHLLTGRANFDAPRRRGLGR